MVVLRTAGEGPVAQRPRATGGGTLARASLPERMPGHRQVWGWGGVRRIVGASAVGEGSPGSRDADHDGWGASGVIVGDTGRKAGKTTR